MRDVSRRGGWYRSPVAAPAISPTGTSKMSSSNLAARMEHAATDALSHPPRPETREAANDEQVVVKAVRPSLSFTNRKFVVRDQGLRLFRIR
jgi:hypothetical protein